MKSHVSSFLFFIFLMGPTWAQSPLASGTKSLLLKHTTSVSAKGSSVRLVEESYEILNEKARMEASFVRVVFDGSIEKFELVGASTVTQGQVQIVRKGDVKVSKLSDPQYGVADRREAVIPLLKVQVGSVVTVRYKIHRTPIVPDVFDDLLMISNEVLAKEERYIYESPFPLKKALINFDAYDMKESQVGSKFRIEVVPNSKAYAEEGKKPFLGTLILSSGKSWPVLNKYFAQKYEAEISKPLPPEFSKIVQAAKAKPSVKEQIELAAAEISKVVAYAGEWNSKDGKVFPRGHQAVVQTGKGDCKDYSSSLAAIMRGLGYQARAVLTSRQSGGWLADNAQQLKKVPSLVFFNHLITQIKDKQGKTWWVDPTNPMVIADVISSDLLGSPALVLDGASDLEFIPKENSVKGRLFLSQKLSFEGDKITRTVGEIRMSPSSYNSIGMQERQLGPEFIKKFTAGVLGMGLKADLTATKKIDGSDVIYEFKGQTQDWRHKKDPGIKSLVVTTPLAVSMVNFYLSQSFGEVGDFIFESRFSKTPVYEPLLSFCKVRSEWLDYDRALEKVGEEVLVKDLLQIKKSRISLEDVKSEKLKSLVKAVESCARKNEILLTAEKHGLAAEVYEAIHRASGPALEKMTDEDAIKMAILNPSEYTATKMLRYFELAMRTRPKESAVYLGLSQALRAYVGALDLPYRDDYLKEALSFVEKGLTFSPEGYDPDLIGERATIQAGLGKKQEAYADLNLLLKKSPQHFAPYLLGSRLNLLSQKIPEALSWMQRGQNLAKTPVERLQFNFFMRALFRAMGKVEQSHPYIESIVGFGGVPAYQLHLWAREFTDLKKWDKAIEIEKKALDSIDNAYTRESLAWTYCAKVDEQLEVYVKANRGPASLDETKKNLEEALRYDPNYQRAHYLMALYYQEQYKSTQDKKTLELGRPHIEKAYSLKGEDPGVQMIYKQYKNILQF